MLWGSISPRQREIWGLRRNGKTESEISRELSISRQSVHIMLNAAEGKVHQALEEAARVNRLQVKQFDVGRGILTGYSPEFSHKVVVTYSPRNGVRLWYSHDEDCKQCKLDSEWVRIIMGEAEERGIKLTAKESRLPAPKLAKLVFERILGDVDL
jgi:hypothetical protein